MYEVGAQVWTAGKASSMLSLHTCQFCGDKFFDVIKANMLITLRLVDILKRVVMFVETGV